MLSVRSYLTALRASSAYGRAATLQRDGRAVDALRVAREAVLLLRAPHVIRDNPAEASLFVNLTFMIEQLAFNLGEPGADKADLSESLRLLEAIGDSQQSTVRRMNAEWLPFLRERLGQVPPR